MNAEPLRILIIEDHTGHATALCNLLHLRIEGCECTVAPNWEAGLALATNVKHDITLLDLHMPVRDGGPMMDPKEVIRSIPKLPKPVIVITDIDDPFFEIETMCYEYEAVNFFSKAYLGQEIATKEGADLIKSITKAHWRHVLPQRRRKREENGNRAVTGR